jgi:hypothetical protein
LTFFGDQSRSDFRNTYLQVWRKRKMGLLLEPLEAQIADVIAEHPEYADVLDDGERALEREYSPEDGQSNPFLHMALHLAIRDQVATDRPPGIRAAFDKLCRRRAKLDVEHILAEQLAEMIWQSQRTGLPPDEQVYLRRIRRLTR